MQLQYSFHLITDRCQYIEGRRGKVLRQSRGLDLSSVCDGDSNTPTHESEQHRRRLVNVMPDANLSLYPYTSIKPSPRLPSPPPPLPSSGRDRPILQQHPLLPPEPRPPIPVPIVVNAIEAVIQRNVAPPLHITAATPLTHLPILLPAPQYPLKRKLNLVPGHALGVAALLAHCNACLSALSSSE